MHSASRVYGSKKREKTNVEIGNAERFAIRGEEIIAGEFETRDGRFVGVFELEKRAAAADVEELHDAGLAADGHLHAVVAEANGARLRVEDLHALQAVATARVVAFHLALDVPHGQHLVHGGESDLGQLGAVRRDRRHERALLQVQTVDLRTAADRVELASLLGIRGRERGTNTMVGDITSKLGNASTVVESVPRVEFERSVREEEGKLAKIVR